MKEIKFKNEEIVHFSVPSPLHDFYGIGAVVGAWEAHRIWESMADYEIALFENMGRPDMAVWLKQNINEPTKKRLETMLKQSYVGAKKQGQIGVFSKETVEEIQVLGEKLREMSYLEGRKYIREEISAAHRVPISFWTMESSNRAVAQAALYQHALYTVKPYCTRIVEKLNEKLCPKFDDNIFFVYENPVPDDANYLLKEREAYVSRGIKAINEVRKEIGIEPMDGFDVPWLPANLIPAGEGGAQVEAQIDEFWEKVFDRGREKLNEFQAAE
jgi:HK97 family phage portal protein